MTYHQEEMLSLGSETAIFGVLNRPKEIVNTEVGFIFLNSGLLHRPGPFRLYVELARNLSESGFHSLRLDQSGKGDSDRRPGVDVITSAKMDIEDATRTLNKLGISKFVLVGLCSGADDSFWVTQERQDIIGLVQLDGYSGRTGNYFLHYYLMLLQRVTPSKIIRLLKKTFSRTFPLSKGNGDFEDIRNFPDQKTGRKILLSFITKKIKCLYVFTGDVRSYYIYSGQLKQFIGNPDFDKYFEEVYYPDAKHTYPFVLHRTKLVDLVTHWSRSNFTQISNR